MRKRLAFILALLFYASILPWNGNAAYLNTNVGELVVKTGPWVDVRAVEMVCDNTTNDAAAFATFLSSLSDGTTVLVKGMCALGSASWTGLSVTGKNNIRFVGANDSSGFRVLVEPSQTMQTGGGLNPVLWKWSDSSNITFTNLTFDGSGTTQEVFLGIDNVSNPKFYYNRFLNTSVVLHAGTPAIQAYRTTDMDILFNTFDGVQFGAAAGGGSNPAGSNVYGDNYRTKFIGNTVKNFARDGFIMGADDQLAQGNTFYTSTTSESAGIIVVGTWMDGVYRGTRNTTITGNTFKNLTWPGVQSDIVQAVGTTSGYFSDGLVVVNNTFDNVGIDAFYALNVRGAVFSNNTVRGGPTAVTMVNADNAIVSGNWMTGFTAAGVVATSDNGYYNRNITISNNILYSAASGITGIQLQVPVSTTRIDNVIISGNQIDTHGINIVSYDNVFNLHINNNILSANAGAQWNMNISDTNYSTYGNNNITGTLGVTGTGVLLETFGNGNKRGYGTAAPTTGTWKVGDRWYNTAADNVILWKCTDATGSGTWDNLVAAF